MLRIIGIIINILFRLPNRSKYNHPQEKDLLGILGLMFLLFLLIGAVVLWFIF